MAQLTVEAIDYQYFREKNAPREGTVDDPQLLTSSAGTYDFVSRFTNPNPLHWAEVEYHFNSSAGLTPTQRAAILPLDTLALSALGVKAEGQSLENIAKPLTAEDAEVAA